jgi:hypothetical protein
MTFEFQHSGGLEKRVVAENADEARNQLNAWCANEAFPVDGWELVGAATVTTAIPVEETRDGDA